MLPGETPWAECLAVNDDGTWRGRIINRLFGEMTDAEREAILGQMWGAPGMSPPPLPRLHAYHQDQIITFRREDGGNYEIWIPTENQPKAD